MPTFCLDLVSDVFLRLPVKSLLRFRCLSKSIWTEIDSADFVKNHLNKLIQTKIRQKLIIQNIYRGDFYSADFDGNLKEATMLNNPFESPACSGYVGGSCNGLILLVLPNIDLVLWNPFTRQCKEIQPCPVEIHPGYQGNDSFGLGYDSVLDDYKIVLISEFDDDVFVRDVHDYYHVWVFSLRSNSWRRCQNTPLEVCSLSRRSGFANGNLYWCDPDAPLIAFDVANEVFFSIALFPEFFEKIYGYEDLENMVVFGGDLYTNRLTANGKTHEFYLHMSDKSGEELDGSWKKAFAVDEKKLESPENSVSWSLAGVFLNLPYVSWPLAYSKEGDSILIYKKNELFWYYPENEAIQGVEIAGVPPIQSQLWGRHVYHFNVCWESLVSLGNDSIFDGNAKFRSKF